MYKKLQRVSALLPLSPTEPSVTFSTFYFLQLTPFFAYTLCRDFPKEEEEGKKCHLPPTFSSSLLQQTRERVWRCITWGEEVGRPLRWRLSLLLCLAELKLMEPGVEERNIWGGQVDKYEERKKYCSNLHPFSRLFARMKELINLYFLLPAKLSNFAWK